MAQERKQKTIKIVDLFAGTGAFSFAFINTRSHSFKSVFANDMCKSSKKIYDLNHGPNIFKLANLHDVKITEIPQHDILCGGFPCQPFSIAGKRLGFEDERANVFNRIIKILEHHKPRIIILENVKNLTTHDKGNTFKIITKKLIDTGYHIKSNVLDTCKITNIPHHRERIYIVGFRDKNNCDKFSFNFNQKDNVTIESLLEEKVDNEFYYTNRLKSYDLVKNSVTKHIKTNTLYQFRRTYVRENKSGVCPTLTANMGTGGHNVPLLLDDTGVRKLTPRECFNLQGFPSSYKLPALSNSSLYKLAGNAVSVPVVKLIVKRISPLL